MSALLSWVSWVNCVLLQRLLQGPVGNLRAAAHITTGLEGTMTLSCLLASSRVSFLAGFLVLFRLFDLPLQKCTLQFLQSLDGSSFSKLFLSFCHAFWIAGYSDRELALMEPLPCGMHLTGTETELRNICLCLRALLLLRHPGYLCCHYRMLLGYIQLLVPCSSQAWSCGIVNLARCSCSMLLRFLALQSICGVSLAVCSAGNIPAHRWCF